MVPCFSLLFTHRFRNKLFSDGFIKNFIKVICVSKRRTKETGVTCWFAEVKLAGIYFHVRVRSTAEKMPGEHRLLCLSRAWCGWKAALELQGNGTTGNWFKGAFASWPKGLCSAGTFHCRLEGYTEIAFYVLQNQKHFGVIISFLTCFIGVVRLAACKGLDSTGWVRTCQNGDSAWSRMKYSIFNPSCSLHFQWKTQGKPWEEFWGQTSTTENSCLMVAEPLKMQ